MTNLTQPTRGASTSARTGVALAGPFYPPPFLTPSVGNTRDALDHLSCPAMATQCERVFSAARRTLTPERNALGMKVIEACECLRWWWRNGVVSGMPTACPMTPRAVVEAQFVTVLVGDSAFGGVGDEDV